MANLAKQPHPKQAKSLVDRLNEGPVILAEGYIFELERRGYLSAGAFVPDIILEHPEVVERLHLDFLHAGSDVIEALTYYAHREKLRIVGKEHLLEEMNRQALRMARKIANEAMKGARGFSFMAGNICNTNIWNPADAQSKKAARAIFDEMVGWAVEEGADFIVAETFSYAGEAYEALESIKSAGLPAVMNIALTASDKMIDDVSFEDVCKELERRGAVVVGANCSRGPATMMPWLLKIRKAVSCHMAALPVPYRTDEQHKTFFHLEDDESCQCPAPHGRAFPTALDPMLCNRYELGQFAKQAYDNNIRLIGVCCGAAPIHIREVAQALGLNPPSSRYTENMQNHAIFGTNKGAAKHYQEHGRNKRF